MKASELMVLLGDIDERHIDETKADMNRKKKSYRRALYGAVSAACAALIVGAVFAGGRDRDQSSSWKGEGVLDLDEAVDSEETKKETVVPEETTGTQDIGEMPLPVGEWQDTSIGWCIIGGCMAHHESYHSYSVPLEEYVGYEAFDAWLGLNKPERSDDPSVCKHPRENIKAFIDYFEIPRDVFEANCGTDIHDIDLLYSDDFEAIDAYYRDFKSRIFREKGEK